MSCSIDIACVSTEGRRLVVLVRAAVKGVPAELPWRAIDPDADPATSAARVARDVLGHKPGWMAALGGFGGGTSHPSGTSLSLGFVVTVAAGAAPPDGYEWTDGEEHAAVGGRQRRMVREAVRALRDRMDLDPVAFHLLPARFTLAQVQVAYEILLERRVHKAPFRRALLAASLVVATDEWTSEGRGRPARYYRYAPRPKRALKRPIRFDSLG